MSLPLNTGLEKTDVLYGAENATNLLLQMASRAKSRIDFCNDYTIPSVSIRVELFKNAISEAKRKYLKFRYITEITHKNILVLQRTDGNCRGSPSQWDQSQFCSY